MEIEGAEVCRLVLAYLGIHGGTKYSKQGAGRILRGVLRLEKCVCNVWFQLIGLEKRRTWTRRKSSSLVLFVHLEGFPRQTHSTTSLRTDCTVVLAVSDDTPSTKAIVFSGANLFPSPNAVHGD